MSIIARERRVSYWHKVRVKKGTPPDANPTLPELHAMITGGQLASVTEAIKALYAPIHALGGKDAAGATDEGKALVKAYSDAKTARLPAITAHGVFSARGNENLAEHNGLQMVDIDGVDDPEALRETLSAQPETALAHITPSGQGVRALVAIAPDPETNDDQYAAYEAIGLWLSRLGLPENDTNVKNIERVSFLVHDAGATLKDPVSQIQWARAAPKTPEPPPGYERELREDDLAPPNGGRLSHDDYLDALLAIPVPPEYADWVRIVAAAKDAGLSQDEVEVWSSRGSKYKAGEVVNRWESFSREGSDAAKAGTLIWTARKHGYETPGEKGKRERRERKTSDYKDEREPNERLEYLEEERKSITPPGAAIRALFVASEDMALVKPQMLAVTEGKGREDYSYPIWLDGETGLWARDDERTLDVIAQSVERFIETDLAEKRDAMIAAAEANETMSDTEKAKDKARAWAKFRMDSDKARRDQRHSALKDIQALFAIKADAYADAGEPFKCLRVDETRIIDPPTRYIGAKNGVVDLDSGELLSPADGAAQFITQTIGAAYDPNATHADAAAIIALERLEPELRSFAQDSLAWALRGTPAKRLNLLFDDNQGNSGKTTLLNAIAQTLGDYAEALSLDAMQSKRGGDRSATPEARPLVMARFVYVEEAQQSKHLDAPRVKSITGGAGAEINFRMLYGNPKTGRIKASIFASANGRIELDLTDRAAKARYTPIPFAAPEKPDARFETAFNNGVDGAEARRAALFAFLVKRCADMSAPPELPEAVKEAVKSHEKEQLGAGGEWALERLERGVRADFVETRAAFAAAKGQLKDALEMKQAQFTRMLQTLFGLGKTDVKKVDGKNLRGLFGLRWKGGSPPEPEGESGGDSQTEDAPEPESGEGGEWRTGEQLRKVVERAGKVARIAAVKDAMASFVKRGIAETRKRGGLDEYKVTDEDLLDAWNWT